MRLLFALSIITLHCFAASLSPGFLVDMSPQPSTHPPLTPKDGETVTVNPPSLIWRVDARAESYQVEFSQNADFHGASIMGVPVRYPFYNHTAPLPEGRWYWRYRVTTKEGTVSAPSASRSFVIPAGVPELPLPASADLLARLPAHPRIFVTPTTLDAFRKNRFGASKAAWENIQTKAARELRRPLPNVGKKVAIEGAKIVHSSISNQRVTWEPGQPVRRQVFFLDQTNHAFWLPNYSYRDLDIAAGHADLLSLAWLVSGEERYAKSARRWLDFVADYRIDYHLTDAQRASHDTVVYAYEKGLTSFALAYDRLHDRLTPEERQRALAHIAYHADSAGRWIKDINKVHLEYQDSHVQQCMHNLLTTVLAAAGELPEIDQWVTYLVPQYVNRLAWTSPDGGYFEGQTYSYKFGMILESLAAIRSACGIDLFQRPEVRHAGRFWLYTMDFNYWFQQWGDVFSLIWSHANLQDSYISGFLAAMTKDPYVKWYADTVLTDPNLVPSFRYLSDGSVSARPPIDIAQARAFPDTGLISAYDRFNDHGSDRIFFRSSQWGSHSHAHADQNSFIIHSGGEILAPDTGYYTYYGDDYHFKWSKSTFAHNTLLVNGQPQPLGIESKGRISEYFHGGALTYFQGDASKAYAEPLKTFRRSILFIRPHGYVIYDELTASKPSKFSWLLNTFDRPEIDEAAHHLTVAQGRRRLDVQHLLPAHEIGYTTNNKRPYPMDSPGKPWSRYSEEYPQPWHTQIDTLTAKTHNTFLTYLHTRDVSDPLTPKPATVENGTTVALTFADGGAVLFRRESDHQGIMQANTIRSDALMAAVLQPHTPEFKWMLVHASQLTFDGKPLWQSERQVQVEADFSTPAARARIRIEGIPGRVQMAVPAKPAQVFAAIVGQPATAKPLPFTWSSSGVLIFSLAQESTEIWVDPVVDLTSPIPNQTLTVQDEAGSHAVPLESGWSELGEWVYFTNDWPRDGGDYRLQAQGADILVQDRWDGRRSVRGENSAVGPLRTGTELYLRISPSAALPDFTAQLVHPYHTSSGNLLFNGDFESGTVGYPPIGWTLNFSARNIIRRSPNQVSQPGGWPEWTQAEAFEGKSAVCFHQGSRAIPFRARPMRLLEGGTYQIRLQAKGDLRGAVLSVRSSLGQQIRMPINPSKVWHAYQTEGYLPEGYTLLTIDFPAGNKGPALWLDDIRVELLHSDKAIDS